MVSGGWFCAWNSFCAAISGALTLTHELWENRATIAVKRLQTSFLESGVRICHLSSGGDEEVVRSDLCVLVEVTNSLM